MQVREFVQNTAGKIASAVQSGEPLHISHGRSARPYVTVVSTEWWVAAKAALEAQQRDNAKGSAA